MTYRKWIKGTIPSIRKILTILINRPLGCSYIGVPTGGCLISLNKDSSLSINSNASCSSSLTRRSYRCRDDDVWDITKLNSSHTSKCMPTDNHFYSVNSSIHVFHSTVVFNFNCFKVPLKWNCLFYIHLCTILWTQFTITVAFRLIC